MKNNKLCINCKFYYPDGKFCKNQGSYYYYKEIPDREIDCKKYIEKSKK